MIVSFAEGTTYPDQSSEDSVVELFGCVCERAEVAHNLCMACATSEFQAGMGIFVPCKGNPNAIRVCGDAVNRVVGNMVGFAHRLPCAFPVAVASCPLFTCVMGGG